MAIIVRLLKLLGEDKDEEEEKGEEKEVRRSTRLRKAY